MCCPKFLEKRKSVLWLEPPHASAPAHSPPLHWRIGGDWVGSTRGPSGTGYLQPCPNSGQLSPFVGRSTPVFCPAFGDLHASRSNLMENQPAALLSAPGKHIQEGDIAGTVYFLFPTSTLYVQSNFL